MELKILHFREIKNWDMELKILDAKFDRYIF